MQRNSFNFEDYLKNKSFFIPVKKAALIAFLVTLFLGFMYFIIYLPAINFQNLGFDLTVLILIVFFGLLTSILSGKVNILFNALKLAGVGACLIFIGILSSLSMFRAKDYQAQLDVDDIVDFNETFEAIDLSNIPVVDKDVAITLGDKKIGEVQGLGSQYDIDNTYTIINQKEKIYRVSPLVYQDVIKWFQNRSEGIPGYIKINVNDPNETQLVMLDEGMRISPSGYLFDNLSLYVRLHYPTAMIGDCSFELDDENNPHYVLSTYSHKIGLFGGVDSNGVIVVNPVNGDINRYNLDEVPSWVDHVQSVNVVLNQLDNWGYFIHGFFNTLFGQKDMLTNTNGYNYVTIESQIYLYSGMTSIGSDHSIVGFGLINLQNKDAKFFKIGGADEESAMSSAQGQVQNLGYYATYPILLNMEGIPSYFVSLKDQEGLVKKYAFISVSNYSLVGVGDNVEEAQKSYLNVLKSHNIITQPQVRVEYDEYQGVIKMISSAMLEGNTYYYLMLEDYDELFIININASNELPLTSINDEVIIKCTKSSELSKQGQTFDNLEYQY